MTRFLTRRTALAIGVAGLAAVALAAPAGAQQKVKMAQAIDAVDFLPVYVAKHFNLYKKHGLDVEITVTGASGPDVAALIAGDVDFAATAPPPMFNAYTKGQKTLGIFNLETHTSVQVLINHDTAKRIGFEPNWSIEQRVKALKGLKVGITRPGALTDSLARHYIKSAGYEPNKDVQIVAVGGGAGMLAALEQGHVDLIMGFSPIAEEHLVANKSRMYIDVSKGEDPQIKELLGQILAVRADWADKNEATVKKMIAALTEACQWIVKASDKDIVEVLKVSFKTISEPALAMTAAHQRAMTPPTGRITQAGVDTAMRMHIDGGGMTAMIPFDAMFTNKFLVQ